MSHNKLGDYIFRRMQKENRMRRNTHAREYMTGLYLTSSDIQRYVNAVSYTHLTLPTKG